MKKRAERIFAVSLFAAAAVLLSLFVIKPYIIRIKRGAPEKTEMPLFSVYYKVPEAKKYPYYVPESNRNDNAFEKNYTAGFEPLSPCSFIYDTKADDFYYLSSDENKRIYPASVTKLFTAYVSLKHLSPDEKITVGKEISFVFGNESVAGLKAGQTLSVKDLLYGMLLPSGNDASYVLATACGRKISKNPNLSESEAVSVFIDELNSVFSEMGLENTHFSRPDGYHSEDHYTTVKDVCLMLKAVSENEIISEVVRTAEYTAVLEKGKNTVWKNTNKTVCPTSEFYCKNAIGFKTGYTVPAGNCLVSGFSFPDRTLFIGVFGSKTEDGRFSDTLGLYNKYKAEKFDKR